MAKKANMSSADKAKVNAEKLRQYIRSTSLKDIPRNQYKAAAKNPILTKLGISPSTISSNKSIKKQFVKLDDLLRSIHKTDVIGKSSDVRQLEVRINTLENCIAAYKVENETLRSKLKVYEHCESTGRMVRL